MVNPAIFLELLKDNGIGFFTGVPDSLLKSFCACVQDSVKETNHIININEGAAIALGAGYHIATGKTPLIYMQNSGLGNATNPLLSLVDKEIYSIPMLLLIGWRGSPGLADEPQHLKQGRITLSLLDVMEIPYWTIDPQTEEIPQLLDKVFYKIRQVKAPVAIVVKKNTFEKYNPKSVDRKKLKLSRERAIQLVTEKLSEADVIVSTTGKISRELFEYRKKNARGHQRDFLTVGSMGFASQIAFGITIGKAHKNVYCFDGDGAMLMHMGNLALIGENKRKNFKHVLFNNGAHDSVGGQPTLGFNIDFLKIAENAGYKSVFRARTEEQLNQSLQDFISCDGPSLFEIQVKLGSRDDLIRPDISPKENLEMLKRFLD